MLLRISRSIAVLKLSECYPNLDVVKLIRMVESQFGPWIIRTMYVSLCIRSGCSSSSHFRAPTLTLKSPITTLKCVLVRDTALATSSYIVSTSSSECADFGAYTLHNLRGIPLGYFKYKIRSVADTLPISTTLLMSDLSTTKPIST